MRPGGAAPALDAEKLSQWLQCYRNRLCAIPRPTITQPGVNDAYVDQFWEAWQVGIAAQCTFCGGHGHEAKECATSIKWTREARKCGFGAQWGELKGLAYFRGIMANWTQIEMAAYLQ